MHIIALQGRGGTGKTTTLKRLIKEVMAMSNFVLEDIVEGDDSQCWLSYNNIKIGITTRGDAEECLYNDFFGNSKNFSDRDIVVCAIRTRGGTLDFVNKYSPKGLVIHGRWFIEGTENIEKSRMLTCTMQAEAILKDIINFINKLESQL